MTITQTVTETFEILECGDCGIRFGVPAKWLKEKRDTHESWKCPNGHSRVFTGETEAERLKRELALERSKSDQLKAQVDEQAKKLGRLESGVCSCCNRFFENLNQHMKSKHRGAGEMKRVAASHKGAKSERRER